MPDSQRQASPRPPTFYRPFAAVPRIACYHPAAAIETARGDLERAVRRGEGFGVVVGPPGTGKTLLLAVLADRLRSDFDVALLAGARICTRRALWQSILSELGEPYRGHEEGDLRMAVVERVRTLAASASGLVLLLDEAHTLPERLLEEIRLLSGLPTPIPAVHVVLAGTLDLEERLASPRHDSLSQRIAVRCALGRLDHAETAAYLRSQCAAASLSWEERFAAGCDDAVFTISDGVPRVINQICDRALRMASERVADADRHGLVTPGNIEEAWRQIQQLPPARAFIERTAPMGQFERPSDPPHQTRAWPLPEGEMHASEHVAVAATAKNGLGDDVVEFGTLDEDAWVRHDRGSIDRPTEQAAQPSRPYQGETAPDPWSGPDIELLFDAGSDPFEELFESVERVEGRLLVRGPDDFTACPRVVSEEGERLARRIDAWRINGDARVAEPDDGPLDQIHEGETASSAAPDDRDLLVIEEDDDTPYASVDPLVFAVRTADYRSLFARLRRGR